MADWSGCFHVPDMVVSSGSFLFLRRAFALVWLAGGPAGVISTAEARIGDTPDQMSARMLQPNLGKNFSWPKNMNAREVERAEKESPLAPFLHLLPTPEEGWREEIYWKSALADQLSVEDGWRVHAFFLKGRSVVELYRRVGAPLNEFEVKAILARIRSGQTWNRVSKSEAKENKPSSVLGFEYELGEGEQVTLRARKQGDWLVLFHKRFDDLLVARKKRWEETEGQRKALLAIEQAKTAPVSVEGF